MSGRDGGESAGGATLPHPVESTCERAAKWRDCRMSFEAAPKNIDIADSEELPPPVHSRASEPRTIRAWRRSLQGLASVGGDAPPSAFGALGAAATEPPPEPKHDEGMTRIETPADCLPSCAGPMASNVN